jgi:hypothetical protein
MDKMLGLKARRNLLRVARYTEDIHPSRNALRPTKSSVRHQENAEWQKEQAV